MEFKMEFKETKKVLIKILFLNWLVALAKILLGFFSGSLSITADGFHSLFDGFSNILGLIGIKIAEKPVDKNHPYGHRKYESLAAMGILFFLFIVAYEFIRDIIERFLEPLSPEISFIFFGVLAGCLLIDWLVAKYEYKKGRELKSQILIADSLHTKSHIFITSSVILGAVFIRLGFPILDPIIASFVVLLLFKFGYHIFKETSIVLSDGTFIDTKRIENVAGTVKGVESSHQIRSRGSESHIFLDMHICLEPDISLEKAHQISHQVREKIQKEIPEIKDVVIHIEPENKGKECVCK
ncbi:MAG: cation-efflux pump [Parcubacteria group bacterium CG11_big_fil_rev_8_21_14_0_20_39_14]|nr:MAG: cation-efflux pump [Parcubacteria group bacterium CG11_big_fil_rev_8_21_14_0_20_39_14]PIS35374.1 MAG: cation transporter [Parcubacteria group bacterium CG08_land_8_20_14_0_20_38_56]